MRQYLPQIHSNVLSSVFASHWGVDPRVMNHLPLRNMPNLGSSYVASSYVKVRVTGS